LNKAARRRTLDYPIYRDVTADAESRMAERREDSVTES
jgi:hypothetical protein